jgi:hypothetical protein
MSHESYVGHSRMGNWVFFFFFSFSNKDEHEENTVRLELDCEAEWLRRQAPVIKMHRLNPNIPMWGALSSQRLADCMVYHSRTRGSDEAR